MGQVAVRLDAVPTNEAMKVRLLREDNARTRFMDAEELKRLIQVARNWKNPLIYRRCQPAGRAVNRQVPLPPAAVPPAP